MKPKIYCIKLSRYFLMGHPRAGEPTLFIEKFRVGQRIIDEQMVSDIVEYGNDNLQPKIHTIRGNYELWAARIREVQEGKAVLRVQAWSDKPYRSKAVTICDLTAADGVGCQKVVFDASGRCPIWAMAGNRTPLYRIDDQERGYLDVETIAHNDGLSFYDFVDWFDGQDTSEPMAIIHFTNFRY